MSFIDTDDSASESEVEREGDIIHSSHTNEGPGISNNKLKKLERYRRSQEKKKSKRKEEQERRREKYKLSRQEGGISKDELRNVQLQNLRQAMIDGPQVCIDLQFEEHMNEKEINQLANQLKRVYSSNKASSTPFNLMFASLKKSGEIFQRCVEKNQGFENYLVRMDEKNVSELFSPSQLIYLSPDSSNPMETFDKEMIYVIGGLVDDSVRKNTSTQFAEENDIRTFRLPIPEYMNKSEKGSFKQILTINQVFDILLSFYTSSCWRYALTSHVPLKTGFV